MPSEDVSRKELGRSIRLIRFGLTITVVLLLAVAFIVWRGYVADRQSRVQMQASEEVLSRIEFFGTGASRFRDAALATSSDVFADAYRTYASRLDSALADAEQVVARPAGRIAAQQADSLNLKIMEVEEQALTAAMSGDSARARDMLRTRQFESLVHAYSEALLPLARTTDAPRPHVDLRLLLLGLNEEVDFLERLHLEQNGRSAAGLLSPHVVEHRLNAEMRRLDNNFDGSDLLPRLQAQIDQLKSEIDDDPEAFRAAADTARAIVGELLQRVESHERLYEAGVTRRSILVPVLLSLILVVLLAAWVGISRMLRRNLRERDLTLRRLRESETKNEALIRAIPDLIFVHDENGRYLDYRGPADGGDADPPDEFVGRSVEEVLPDEVATPVKRAIKTAAATGSSQYLEYELTEGTETSVYEARLVPMGDGRVLSIVRDMTARRTAEQARREADVRFRSLVEHSLVGTYIVQNDRFLYVNPRFAEVVGRDVDEIIGSGIDSIVVPEDMPIVAENLRRRMAGEIEHVHYTVRGEHSDGRQLTAEVFGSVIELNGQPAVIGTLLDVTEREQARLEMARLKEFYEETLNRLPIEVAVVDRDLRFVYLNPVAARGAESQEAFLGRTVEELQKRQGTKNEAVSARTRWLQHVLQSGRTSSMEETVTTRSGRLRHLLRVAAPMADEHGEVHHIVGYTLDMSERKEYERRLVDAKERAEEMARMKSTFLANMSHEIRTPLTGILGFASLLEEEATDQQRQFATLIVKSGKRLLETLNAVLDLSRIEAGEMVLNTRPTDLCDEVREAATALRSLATEKGLELTVDTPDGAIMSMIDRGALHIILNNLIGNAIKFTERGVIRMTVSAQESRARIVIADTGVGIDASFMPQLFDEFKQESIGLTRSHEGAGLGLAITRRLVLMMGGSIDVESSKGEGTSFCVSFPRAAEQLDLALIEEPVDSNNSRK